MKSLTPEQNAAIAAYLKEGWRPRLMVRPDYVRYGVNWRRPVKKRGHYGIRMQGFAWLIRPNKEVEIDPLHGSKHIFSVTFNPDFLDARAEAGND